MSNRLGGGSNSYGSLWYGKTTQFPGFLYKKNIGGGARRSTRMGAGGNSVSNASQSTFYNQYRPGMGGIGANSIATRRAKMNRATICDANGNCFPCYSTLGQQQPCV